MSCSIIFLSLMNQYLCTIKCRNMYHRNYVIHIKLRKWTKMEENLNSLKWMKQGWIMVLWQTSVKTQKTMKTHNGSISQYLLKFLKNQKERILYVSPKVNNLVNQCLLHHPQHPKSQTNHNKEITFSKE